MKKIILWDLHEVIFTHSLLNWVTLFIRSPKKWSVIKELDLFIITLGFRYLLHITHIKNAELSSQELIKYAQKKNKKAIIDMTVHIGSAYKPIAGTVQLIDTLHKKGYTQHIGSNIGSTIFKHFSKKYTSIFSYFTSYHIVYYDGPKLIKKPNPQFFKSYLEKHTFDPSSILFVDDKKYNIEAARSLGIDSILFTNSEQLTKELKERNLL